MTAQYNYDHSVTNVHNYRHCAFVHNYNCASIQIQFCIFTMTAVQFYTITMACVQLYTLSLTCCRLVHNNSVPEHTLQTVSCVSLVPLRGTLKDQKLNHFRNKLIPTFIRKPTHKSMTFFPSTYTQSWASLSRPFSKFFLKIKIKIK